MVKKRSGGLIMREKGFTLVELLAVIVILAIVLAITIPTITGIISNAKKNAFASDANMILKGVDYQLLQDSTYLDGGVNVSKLTTDLMISDKNYEEINLIYIEDDKVYIYIEGKEKWDGLVACGTFNNMLVGDGSQCEVPISGWQCGDLLVDDRDGGTEYAITLMPDGKCWMAENLRYTGVMYEDIPCTEVEWIEGATYNYMACRVHSSGDTATGGDYTKGEVYKDEVLYQHGAAMNGASLDTSGTVLDVQFQGACPPGWHVPSEIEWQELERALGMPEISITRDISYGGSTEGIGNMLKGTNLINWDIGTVGVDKRTGFNAIPSGSREK